MDSKVFLYVAMGAIAMAVVIGAAFVFSQPAAPSAEAAEATPPALATSNPTASPQLQLPEPTAQARDLPFSWGPSGAQSCAGAKPIAWFFEDPYSYTTTVSNGKTVPTETYVGFFEGKFAGAADIDHKILPIRSQKMIEAHDAKRTAGYANDRYARANVELAAKYFVCAEAQAKLSEFKSCFYDNILTVQFADGTSDFLPMNEAELDSCASMLDSAQLDACIPTAGAVLSLDKSDAARLGVDKVPLASINCAYRGHSALAGEALCFYYPATPGC